MNPSDIELNDINKMLVYEQQSRMIDKLNEEEAKLVGAVNMPSELSANASELFARNIWELLKLIAPKGELILDRNDEIVQGCLICSNGEIYHNA